MMVEEEREKKATILRDSIQLETKLYDPATLTWENKGCYEVAAKVLTQLAKYAIGYLQDYELKITTSARRVGYKNPLIALIKVDWINKVIEVDVPTI